MRGGLRKLSVGAAIAVAGLAGGAQSNDAVASPPGGTGKLAFVAPLGVSFYGSNWHVFGANADGTGAADLTPGLSDTAVALAWSPDGTRLAFTAIVGGLEADEESDDGLYSFALYVMNADGSGQQKVATFRSGIPTPAWSPDGSEIAYSASIHDEFHIVATRADGSATRSIANLGKALVAGVNWSPDGATIAFTADFTSGGGERLHLWAVNADGTGLRKLRPEEVVLADWAPDGSRLAVNAIDGLRTTTPDGSASDVLLAATDEEDEYEEDSPSTTIFLGPGWSPDGARIAFSATRWSELPVVGALNTDGSCPTQLVSRFSFSPAWQPVPGGLSSGPLHCADLAVTNVSSPALVGKRRPFTLEDEVTNQGNLPAADSHLVQVFPRGIAAESATSTAGACTLETHRVDCALGALAPGAKATISIVAHAAAVRLRGQGSITVATATADPDPADDLGDPELPRVCTRMGTEGADRIIGTPGRDVICALGGNDRIRALRGNDEIYAGPGQDVVLGGLGSDDLDGGPGGDTLDGGRDTTISWADPGRTGCSAATATTSSRPTTATAISCAAARTRTSPTSGTASTSSSAWSTRAPARAEASS